jgi:hypothetical protein
MAVAQPHILCTRLKLVDAPASMIEGNKFLKWAESSPGIDKNNNSMQPIGVTLRIDPKCFILYWRDANKVADFVNKVIENTIS